MNVYQRGNSQFCLVAQIKFEAPITKLSQTGNALCVRTESRAWLLRSESLLRACELEKCSVDELDCCRSFETQGQICLLKNSVVELSEDLTVKCSERGETQSLRQKYGAAELLDFDQMSGFYALKRPGLLIIGHVAEPTSAAYVEFTDPSTILCAKLVSDKLTLILKHQNAIKLFHTSKPNNSLPSEINAQSEFVCCQPALVVAGYISDRHFTVFQRLRDELTCREHQVKSRLTTALHQAAKLSQGFKP